MAPAGTVTLTAPSIVITTPPTAGSMLALTIDGVGAAGPTDTAEASSAAAAGSEIGAGVASGVGVTGGGEEAIWLVSGVVGSIVWLARGAAASAAETTGGAAVWLAARGITSIVWLS